ncbi:hypothetical protein CH063_10536 [Colletotrichum higginsianum]|uniref:Uncharacterized protein n=1 Tax=Colletotrichum higginsianum (strain IMI 349063) TaxID=759273 RepID=H1VHV2_COLHI|nr:hypothetical protein CH063_10536 [Colletotrichum higginsianum]
MCPTTLSHHQVFSNNSQIISISSRQGCLPLIDRQPLRPSPHIHCTRRDSAVAYLSRLRRPFHSPTPTATANCTGRASTGTRGRRGFVSSGTQERPHLQASFPESLYIVP